MNKRAKHSGNSAFALAVRQIKILSTHYRQGLQALRNADRNQTHCNQGRPTGSVDIDDAYRPSRPTDNRWDYAIGHAPIKNPERVIYVEFHSAITSAVRVVLRKRQWLLDLLNSDDFAHLRKLPSRIVWVASGRFDILKQSPQYRLAA